MVTSLVEVNLWDFMREKRNRVGTGLRYFRFFLNP